MKIVTYSCVATYIFLFHIDCIFSKGITVNPASMKQALTASAVRLEDANMFEQGKFDVGAKYYCDSLKSAMNIIGIVIHSIESIENHQIISIILKFKISLYCVFCNEINNCILYYINSEPIP